MKKVYFILFINFLFLFFIQKIEATLGIDISMDICNSIQPSDWDCLINHGYTFAIIEAWDGGFGFNHHISKCVNDALNAGMKHVDVYAFICPNCGGTASYQIEATLKNLTKQGVNFGMLWFDIEQCHNCWNDVTNACDFVSEGVNKAIEMGYSIGIYSSAYEWVQTVGNNCNKFSNYPLWYAHYDGKPSYTDSWAYRFGGWTKPSMKQYNDHGPCTNVDVNYYP